MSKYYTFSASFQIDQDDDKRPLSLVRDSVTLPIVQADYNVDADDAIQVTCAVLFIGEVEMELDLKNESINKWVYDGCVNHFECTMQPAYADDPDQYDED